MQKTKLPGNFRSYFWDVDFDSLYLEEAPKMILKRLLDRGTTQAIFWVKKHYTNEQIKDLLLTSRDLDQKTATFWATILNIELNQVKCLQKPYSQIHWGLYS